MKTLREYVITPGRPLGLQPGVPDAGRGGGEVGEIVAPRLEEDGRFGAVEGHAVTGPLERPAHRVGRRRLSV